jgi:site-specific DNA-methyltransferase (adenine-specific)
MATQINYNPDILSCLANLSNDEVFTSPALANEILDCLPQELFKNKKITFLDPVAKSGVFLREIAKRLIVGLETEIPNLQDRVNHIFHNQIYGIAITELTSMLSRRSVYCSKKANNKYSIAENFNTEGGNILFEKTEHTWEEQSCKFCGANKNNYSRSSDFETHAYKFIHVKNPEEIFKMKFDVIIGNPPYQLQDGGSGGSAIPIYHKFIQQAKKLDPRFLVMIIPSRWFAGGRGLDEFRQEMLNDTSLKFLADYPISSECFQGVEIKGGVCYFLIDRHHEGKCVVKTIRKDKISQLERYLLEDGTDTFIRFNEAIPIFSKVYDKNVDYFSMIVSTLKPFGFRTYFQGSKESVKNNVKVFGNKLISYISRDEVINNSHWIDSHKIFISRAYGAGEDFPHQIINKPFYGEPGSCCTETYLHIGPFKSKAEADNALSYMKTKFFRFFVMLKKNTQDGPKSVYQFVPIQKFTESWSDEKLYKKYGLNSNEIDFIESMIRPMGEDIE